MALVDEERDVHHEPRDQYETNGHIKTLSVDILQIER